MTTNPSPAYGGRDVDPKESISGALFDLWARYGEPNIPATAFTELLSIRGYDVADIDPAKLKNEFLEKCKKKMLTPWGAGNSDEILLETYKELKPKRHYKTHMRN